MELRTGFVVRPYAPEDEGQVIDLLSLSLGPGPTGARTREFFRWKHFHNPFGTSLMLVAELEGTIVGLRAFLRWGFMAAGRWVRGLRAVDTATHPEHRGQGVFSSLTKEALVSARGQADLVFNTPNDRSLAGYLKMGWRVVGRIPVHVRVVHPLRFVSRLRSLQSAHPTAPTPASTAAPRASEVLARASGIDSLLQEVTAARQDRLTTARDLRYLQWRYGQVPGLDYRALTCEAGGDVIGLVIFRVRPRGDLVEATISELVIRPGDRRTASRLLGSVRAAANVDHLTARFEPSLEPGMVSFGFVRAPGGVTLVTNPLNAGLLPEPTDLRSWGLSIGDLEVF
ncbi:MAG TPA: GNAT family N-acetyltransferase [Actinomycetota bacterium]|nr:GNAT family N-acetyltransferase [Actinomycetota bacterium]